MKDWSPSDWAAVIGVIQVVGVIVMGVFGLYLRQGFVTKREHQHHTGEIAGQHDQPRNRVGALEHGATGLATKDQLHAVELKVTELGEQSKANGTALAAIDKRLD